MVKNVIQKENTFIIPYYGILTVAASNCFLRSGCFIEMCIRDRFGGIRTAEEACTTYGYTPNPEFHKIFTDYHKTHNQAVFDSYTPEMKKARHNKIITGLPDTYGRGRIVGDYRLSLIHILSSPFF